MDSRDTTRLTACRPSSVAPAGLHDNGRSMAHQGSSTGQDSTDEKATLVCLEDDGNPHLQLVPARGVLSATHGRTRGKKEGCQAQAKKPPDGEIRQDGVGVRRQSGQSALHREGRHPSKIAGR